MAESPVDGVDLKTLEAKCHCGSVHFTIDVPTSTLPLPVRLCHCSICRFNSGSPCVFHTNIPEGVTPKFIAPSTEAAIKDYVTDSIAVWKFCATCGAHIASAHRVTARWAVSTSIFIDHGPSNFRIEKHIFSKSTKDGGIVNMLSHIGGREFIDWNPPDDDPRAKLVEAEPEFSEDGEERLRAQCRCGGVSFTIKRPTQEVKDNDFFKKYISPLDDKKWMATMDICNTCRFVHGTHVVGWTFVPLSLCEPAIKSDLKIGTAKTYSSSPGVLRSFCGECGATVFYWTELRRPGEGQDIVDIATGILRAPEGTMADNWLTWRSRIAHLESGREYDEEFADALNEGSKAWSIAKYGHESTYSIP